MDSDGFVDHIAYIFRSTSLERAGTKFLRTPSSENIYSLKWPLHLFRNDITTAQGRSFYRVKGGMATSL